MHKCEIVRTRRGGRPCPPGGMHLQAPMHLCESALCLQGSMPRSPRTGHDRFYDAPQQICHCPTGGQRRPPLQDVVRGRRILCDFVIAFCAGGASPSPTLRRNVQQLGNMRPFSSPGASRHLPHMGKAGAILISPALPVYPAASTSAARHISRNPPPRPRRRGRTRCRCRHFCRRRCRCRRGRR